MEASSKVRHGIAEAKARYQPMQGNDVAAFRATRKAAVVSVCHTHSHRRMIFRALLMNRTTNRRPLPALLALQQTTFGQVLQRRRQ